MMRVVPLPRHQPRDPARHLDRVPCVRPREHHRAERRRPESGLAARLLRRHRLQRKPDLAGPVQVDGDPRHARQGHQGAAATTPRPGSSTPSSITRRPRASACPRSRSSLPTRRTPSPPARAATPRSSPSARGCCSAWIARRSRPCSATRSRHVANGDMVTLTLIQGVVNTFVIFLSRVIGFVVDRVVRRATSASSDTASASS